MAYFLHIEFKKPEGSATNQFINIELKDQDQGKMAIETINANQGDYVLIETAYGPSHIDTNHVISAHISKQDRL
jgi:hypothetical protein